MNENITKRMTPRQRCAIVYPIADTELIPHARHHKRNGHVQSILTFDVASVSSLPDADDKVRERAVDGWFGIWHARVSMHPTRLLVAWNRSATEQAKGVLLRCVSKVGINEDIEVHNGADLKSIHVYKWATHDEVIAAFEECGGFGDLLVKQKARS